MYPLVVIVSYAILVKCRKNIFTGTHVLVGCMYCMSSCEDKSI